MNLEELISFVDELVYVKTCRRLKDIEILIIRGSWQGQNYDDIAELHGYTDSYLRQDIGPKLWKLLSDICGERVSKTNFRAALERQYRSSTTDLTKANGQIVELLAESGLVGQSATVSSQLIPNFPEGLLAVDSPFYISRPPIETECYQEVLKPGSLIRIKASRKMGKTSLLNRVLAYAEQHHYQVIRINLRQAEKSTFTDLDKFLRWFCANASRQLNLKPCLEDHWDEEIGSKVSCTGYVQMRLLEQANHNLIISLDEIDIVFDYPNIAEDFLSLLREWHEESKIQSMWQRLRLIVTHSTEVYIPLNIHQSPFNVGLPIKLPRFNQQQVQSLTDLYGLDCSTKNIEELIALVGGHPYLIQQALYYLWSQKTSLEQLLETAHTESGIYREHLRSYLGHLQKRQELSEAFKRIVSSSTSIQLDPVLMYQLDSMGLVQFNGNQAEPSCELYRQYFSINLP